MKPVGSTKGLKIVVSRAILEQGGNASFYGESITYRNIAPPLKKQRYSQSGASPAI
jgi:hypothetical protein